jgi:hypothetical protein
MNLKVLSGCHEDRWSNCQGKTEKTEEVDRFSEDKLLLLRFTT